MFTIEKMFSFDSAHFLPRVPEGHKCRRMHGHTYSVTVRVRSESLDDAGMVLDYGELSRAVKPLVESLDHRVLNEIDGLENPTAEVISRWVYDRLRGALPGLDSVVVKETPATASEYRRNGRLANPHESRFCDLSTWFDDYQNGKFPGSPPNLGPEEFYRKFAVAIAKPGTAGLDSKVMVALAEAELYRHFRPQIRVYPSILHMLENTSIDIECRYLRLPFPIFEIVLPDSYDICNIIVFMSTPPPRDAFEIMDAFSMFNVISEPAVDESTAMHMIVVTARQQQMHSYALALEPDRTISSLIEKEWRTLSRKGTFSPTESDSEFLKRAWSIVLGSAFLGIGQMRTTRTDASIVELEKAPRHERRRMERITGRKFDQPILSIGRNLELQLPRSTPAEKADAHVGEGQELAHGYLRSGHLRWQMRGPREGPNDYVLTFVRPHMVRPDLPVRMKTPYGARRPDGETSSVDVRRLEANGRRRRNAVCPGCGATDAYVSPFSGGLSCRACPGKPIPHVQIAANAIKAMYDAWQAHGGVSPDATDELLAAAGALGLKLNHSVARSDPILVAAADEGFEVASDGASLEEIAKVYVEALKQSGRLKRPNGMRRNSDDELRELERAFRRTGAADDAVRLARALIRHGRDRVDTTAFMRSCGVAPVEAHEMVAEATGAPLVEWKLINYGVTGDEESGWDINDLHYTGDKISLPADATYSEVREALVDEGTIRRDLEVDSEASSETNVVFRQPSDQRPAGALERTIRRNPGDEPPVHVRPDGTTTCCNAYSTISADDQVEYCKKCYRAVEGYLDEAVFALPTRVDVAAGHHRCEACSRATGTETRHPMGFKCRRRPRRR